MTKPMRWIKFDPKDFLEGVVGLTPEERGAYITLLSLIYMRAGPIPDEPGYLAGNCGMSKQAWRKVRASLIDKGKIFLAPCGGLMNGRAGAVLKNYEQTSEKLPTNPEETPEKLPRKSAVLETKPNEIQGLVSADQSEKCPLEEEVEKEKKEDANASLSPAAPDDVRRAFDEWNELARRVGLPLAKDLTEGRRRKLRARITTSGLAGWREALAAVEVSKHCRGLKAGRDGGAPWRADIDFLLQPSSFQRLIEGFYGRDMAQAAAQKAKSSQRFSGPPAIRAAFADTLGEAFVETWLDLCGWQDVPTPALTCSKSTVLDRIGRDGWRVLQDNQISLIHTPAVAA